MAKLTLSLLLLFVLIASSESRAPSDLPNDDVSGRDLPGPVVDSTATILLPSEKPESEAATVVKIDPETTAADSNTKDDADIVVADEQPVLEPEKIAYVPLRTVTFRPYDHGGFHEHMVPLSLRFPLRHGGHRCRHGHRQFRPRLQGREISFGNDMILSEEKSGSDPESRGIEAQMPGRWIRVHHRKPRFGYVDVAWKEDKDMMKRPDRYEEREGDEEREHHHHHGWAEDKDMMKRPHRPEEREEDEDREHHHHRWAEDKDMMKRRHRPEEREEDEEGEHHHHRWAEDKDMMKRPHRPEEREDDEDREHHHHRHHHHHFRHHHDHEDEEEEHHGDEGIFKRIRKFLNHF